MRNVLNEPTGHHASDEETFDDARGEMFGLDAYSESYHSIIFLGGCPSPILKPRVYRELLYRQPRPA